MRKYQPKLGLIIVMAAYSMTLFAQQTVDSNEEWVLEEIIVTAQGKCNSEPKPDARSVMEMWATQQGLEIGRGV